MNNNTGEVSSISLKYAEDIVKTIALAQRNNLINDKADLEMIIAAGLELALSEIVNSKQTAPEKSIDLNFTLTNNT